MAKAKTTAVKKTKRVKRTKKTKRVSSERRAVKAFTDRRKSIKKLTAKLERQIGDQKGSPWPGVAVDKKNLLAVLRFVREEVGY